MSRTEAAQRLVTLGYKTELEDGVVMVGLDSDKAYEGLRNQIEKMCFYGSWGCRYPRPDERDVETPAEKADEAGKSLSEPVKEEEEIFTDLKEGQLSLDDLFGF